MLAYRQEKWCVNGGVRIFLIPYSFLDVGRMCFGWYTISSVLILVHDVGNSRFGSLLFTSVQFWEGLVLDHDEGDPEDLEFAPKLSPKRIFWSKRPWATCDGEFAENWTQRISLRTFKIKALIITMAIIMTKLDDELWVCIRHFSGFSLWCLVDR